MWLGGHGVLVFSNEFSNPTGTQCIGKGIGKEELFSKATDDEVLDAPIALIDNGIQDAALGSNLHTPRSVQSSEPLGSLLGMRFLRDSLALARTGVDGMISVFTGPVTMLPSDCVW